MTERCLAPLVVLVLLLAGCAGSGGGEAGTATLWVTKDRGSTVLVDAEVDAGQSLMRALASEIEIETRYGGRYLQKLDGLSGSLERQEDWFWFVNGYEGDRSAAEYTLRDGDVAWWDYRAWEREGEARVVVGAFPEPFLHGYAGKRREAVVLYAPTARGRAEELARQISATSLRPLGDPIPKGANVLEVHEGKADARIVLLGQSAGDPVRFTITGAPELAHRYAARRTAE